MSDLLTQWTKQARGLRGRNLTKEETAALNEELLKGKITPDTDSRKRKRAIRRAIDGASKAEK